MIVAVITPVVGNAFLYIPIERVEKWRPFFANTLYIAYPYRTPTKVRLARLLMKRLEVFIL